MQRCQSDSLAVERRLRRKVASACVAALMTVATFAGSPFALAQGRGDEVEPSFECKKFNPPIVADKTQKHKACVDGCTYAGSQALAFCQTQDPKWIDKCIRKATECLGRCKNQCPPESSKKDDDD